MSNDVRAAAAQANATFVENFNNGNLRGACDVYTDDATILPPGADAIEGKEAIFQFWTGAAAQLGITGVDLKTVSFDAQDGTAEEIGAFTLHGADGVLDQGKFVVVWKRGGDGQWRWHWDIWNSSQG